MNKSELIEKVSDVLGEMENRNISKAEAGRAVDAVLGCIGSGLREGNDITLHGFGNFKLKTKAARTAHNPKTGEKVEVDEKVVVKFVPSKNLL